MTMLVQYVRNRKNVIRGVVVSIPATDGSNPKYRIGFSLCKKSDVFNKKMGIEIAAGRAHAILTKGRVYEIPDIVVPTWNNMLERSKKYFK